MSHALKVVVMCFGLAGLAVPVAWADTGGETAVKTAFLYNFFKFIEWPNDLTKDNFVLCTARNDQLGDSLTVLEHKTISGKPLVIGREISQEHLKKCHIIYIGSPDALNPVIKAAFGLPIVTISDQPDFLVRGGMIGLVQDGNRLSFEINLDLANSASIHISAKLLKLAKNVQSTQ